MNENNIIPNEDDLIDVRKLDDILLDILGESIYENTNSVNKRLELTETTDTIVKKALKKFYNTKQYGNSLLKYVTNLEDISKYKISSYRDKGFSINYSEVNPFQKLAIDEHLSYFRESGLNNKFNQPLRRVIYSNIFAGKSQKELIDELTNYVSKKDPVSRFVKQTAMMGADVYTSIIDQKITDKYIDDITGYIIVGSIIDSSSVQCKYCVKDLKRKIKKEDWEEVKKIALPNGLIEGTEFKNLPTNKLHWGCRHQFTPTID